MTSLPRAAFLLAAASAPLVLHPAPAAQPAGLPREVRIEIGPQGAFVSERRTVVFSSREAEVVFDGVPESARDASFSVRGVRSEVRLLEWTRASAPAAAPAASAGGGDLVWSRRSDAPRAVSGVGPRLTARLKVDAPGPREVEATFLVPGLSWSADYALLVRGGATNENEVVSVDLSGQALISNATTRTFHDARIFVVEEDGARGSGPGPAPGHLELDPDSALGDLWRPETARRGAGHVYDLGVVRRLPAGESVRVGIASAMRRRAERVYVLGAEAHAARAEGRGSPLAQQLVLRNTDEAGLGRALPAGWVTVFVGSLRSQIRQRAWLNAVPAGGELRIDFGLSQSVWATRGASPRARIGEREYEQTLETAVESRLGGDVDVEVEQTPPPFPSWSVTRANKRYEVEEGVIRFRAPVRGGGRERFTCTVRFQEPLL